MLLVMDGPNIIDIGHVPITSSSFTHINIFPKSSMNILIRTTPPNEI